MKIEKIHVLNCSNVHTEKVIEMRLNIGDLQYKSTNTVDGFSDRLKILMPSLYSHKSCNSASEGFFKSIDNGTSFVQVIEHIALELQRLAGIQTELSSAIHTDTSGVYNVLFSYVNEDAGIYAALAAVEIVEALEKGKPYFIRHVIDRMKCLYQQNQSRTETVKEEETVPYFKLNNQPLQFAYGVNRYNIKLNIPLSRVI